jgi:hypothetical protein
METVSEMTVTVLDRALVAGDAGEVADERQERPDPEVPEKARRRSFTAQYKLDVVAEYDAAPAGEKGAVIAHAVPWVVPPRPARPVQKWAIGWAVRTIDRIRFGRRHGRALAWSSPS